MSAVTGPSSIRVVIAENTSMRIQLLADALQQLGMTIAASATSSLDFLRLVPSIKFDVAIVGSTIDEEPSRGFKVVRQLRDTLQTMPPAIVLLESSGRTSVVDAFRAGAKGVISRQDSLESLKECLQCVRSGQIWANKEELSYAMEALTTCPPFIVPGKTLLSALSLREQQVVQCLAEGLTNREIGHRLGLSPHTVKNYLFRIFDKVGVSSRVELLYLLLLPAGTTSMSRSASSLVECRKAAAAGSPGEQLRLAGLYREGDGVPQSLVQAYKWLLICEETIRGLAAQARSMKEKIALSMANTDLIEAERRAVEFLNDMPAQVRPMKIVSEMPNAKANRVSA